jgi:hypothetical protein
VHTLARTKHRQSAPPPEMPRAWLPAHMAGPPRAISGQATGTGGYDR